MILYSRVRATSSVENYRIEKENFKWRVDDSDWRLGRCFKVSKAHTSHEKAQQN